MRKFSAHAREISRALLPVLALAGSAPAVAANDLVLGVCEGTFGGAAPAELVDKYHPLADHLGKALKAHVVVSPVCSFPRLESGIAEQRFDFVMARPADYTARAIRDHGYRYVAQVTPDVSCVYLVPRDSPLKSLADAKGMRITLPEKASYMGQLCVAGLRDAGVSAGGNAQFVKEQPVVMYQLQQKNVDVGGISSHAKAVSKEALEKAGLRELGRSAPQPYFPVIASKKVPAAQVETVRKELLRLSETPEGRALLGRLGLNGYAVGTEERMAQLLAWLEKK
ncbi:MAG: phosphate/phosphite/phosphonate ABC transporter substrate-binding protein [Burkholderiales bacterium]|nr:phosphate/phosphite/phosphonate ABC transporter substrate-binding protein [Burkholderiales bacterium]